MLREKHIRETVRSFGLRLVDCLPTSGGSYRATVEAADGETQVIRINSHDGNQDRLTASFLRRFANAHGRIAPPSKPLPPTSLEAAMMAAQATQPEPVASVMPDIKFVGEAPPMTTLTLAKQPETIVKPRKKSERLTHIQFAKLAALVGALDIAPFKSLDDIAEHLTPKLDFSPNRVHIRDALEMHGKATKYQQVRKAGKPQEVMARAIAHLYEKLGESLPEDLKGLM